MSAAEPDRIALHARDVAFDRSALPVHRIPGEPFATHLLDVPHLLPPEGERWFVRVFSATLPPVRDPAGPGRMALCVARATGEPVRIGLCGA